MRPRRITPTPEKENNSHDLSPNKRPDRGRPLGSKKLITAGFDRLVRNAEESVKEKSNHASPRVICSVTVLFLNITITAKLYVTDTY